MDQNKKSAEEFFKKEVDDYKKEFYESGYRTFMSVRLNNFINEIKKLNLNADSKCLDAGCGPGYLTKLLLEMKYSVTAFDASPEMLRLTKNLVQAELPDSDLPEIKLGDIEDLPFDDNSFDLVASAGVIEYLSTDQKVFSEFLRVLKPGGYLIVSSTNKYSPVGLFEPLIEAIKRNNVTRNLSNFILRKFGGTQVRAREFTVRKHSMNELVYSADAANFTIKNKGYFYALPFPHPFDRVFPKTANFLGSKLEKLNQTFMKYTFEGIYIVAKK